jgi:hypothetical protein
MDIIFSYWDTGHRKFTSLEVAAMSNHLAKKHGHKTHLYADKSGLELFKNIEFDYRIELDEKILKELPARVWSLGKLLAISQHRAPFLHIDFDLMLFKDIPREKLSEDFLCAHPEYWFEFERECYNIHAPKLNIKAPYPYSHNCCIVGGNKYMEINSAAETIINYCIENKVEIENDCEKYKKIRTWIIPSLFEQTFFVNLVRSKLNLIKIPVVFDEMNIDKLYSKFKSSNIVHLWGQKILVHDLYDKYIAKNKITY